MTIPHPEATSKCLLLENKDALELPQSWHLPWPIFIIACDWLQNAKKDNAQIKIGTMQNLAGVWPQEKWWLVLMV